MEHVVAQRTSLKQRGSIGTGKPRKGKNKRKTRSRGREAGTGACKVSPPLSALKETQNILKTDIATAYAILRSIAREKA